MQRDGEMRATSLSTASICLSVALAFSGCGGNESASAASDASFDTARDDGLPDASADVDEASDAALDAIVVDAADEPFDAPTCTGDLSNIGAADFHVSFTLSTTQAGDVAIVQQRATCTHGMFWDVHLVSGRISPETDDGTGSRYTTFNSTRTVNDGNPHAIRVERVSQTLTVIVDGAFVGSATSTSVLGNLVGLEVGTSPCVGIDGYKALIGTVTDLCVTSP